MDSWQSKLRQHLITTDQPHGVQAGFSCRRFKGIIPNQWAMDSTSDPVERRTLEFSERALLNVASSRAIKQLYVTYHGEPSEYL